MQNALAFNCDTCCHLALCLWLILFHWLNACVCASLDILAKDIGIKLVDVALNYFGKKVLSYRVFEFDQLQ